MSARWKKVLESTLGINTIGQVNKTNTARSQYIKTHSATQTKTESELEARATTLHDLGASKPFPVFAFADEACSLTTDAIVPGLMKLWAMTGYMHIFQPLSHIMQHSPGKQHTGEMGVKKMMLQMVLAGDTQQLLASHTNRRGRCPHLIDDLIYTTGKNTCGKLCQYNIVESFRYNHWLLNHTISHKMYEGQIKVMSKPTVPTYYQRTCTWTEEFPLRVYNSAGSKTLQVNTSKVNLAEAARILVYVQELLKRKNRPADIAVIAMYAAQVDVIANMLRTHGIDVAVGSIDSFQGQEAQHVAVSCTTARSHETGRYFWGFGTDNARVNVAITRGRLTCGVFVDFSTLPKAESGGMKQVCLTLNTIAYAITQVYCDTSWMTAIRLERYGMGQWKNRSHRRLSTKTTAHCVSCYAPKLRLCSPSLRSSLRHTTASRWWNRLRQRHVTNHHRR